ncbi:MULTISPECIES: FoF1 ATP synthase subunit B' [unclassified Campylobacter]|uniref:FoF1 ATP synthase subunit B' n=1 Tax=unclassified Campylobacter TaxID=2593542 RepID=UPI001238186C|nr:MULTISPECIES: FoF1 ATP synthase subunit B' [unclassified Campylobacter]KAA6227322.1 F0F1 ATP synthase subunit B' [Campylobacter sp. LR286c]KAA6227803.1 F0F1 ATP synthase subunit B' [Campylobacter sp. LR185c]KAA6228211.1 F0F1 ATP synthase subunit B' [Campylobacter sp. LR196d]KAA6229211.1 F0F1 ATP synthase subunit B' [Campylobacter sp. LR291e]KAA6231016.1 F0F1 ATP synthase subunit B' [Campylobacter sp. LR264d]
MFDDMSPSIMIATVAIFLAMIVILNAIFYKPLLKFMDERDDSIKKDENKVKENSKEMLGANDEVELIYKKTREEIHNIKQSAINEARVEADQLIQAKKDELERKMALFYTELETQKQELKQQLFAYLPDFKQSLQNSIKKV